MQELQQETDNRESQIHNTNNIIQKLAKQIEQKYCSLHMTIIKHQKTIDQKNRQIAAYKKTTDRTSKLITVYEERKA